MFIRCDGVLNVWVFFMKFLIYFFMFVCWVFFICYFYSVVFSGYVFNWILSFLRVRLMFIFVFYMEFNILYGIV